MHTKEEMLRVINNGGGDGKSFERGVLFYYLCGPALNMDFSRRPCQDSHACVAQHYSYGSRQATSSQYSNPSGKGGCHYKYALHNDDYQDMSLTAGVYVDSKAA